MTKTRPPRGRKSNARRRSPRKRSNSPTKAEKSGSNRTTLRARLPKDWPLQVQGSPHDIESHVVARAAFLNLIDRNDPHVAQLFQWGGVLAAAEALALVGDGLAARVGLQHRGQLLTEEFVAGPADEAGVVAATSEWMRDVRAFMTKYNVKGIWDARRAIGPADMGIAVALVNVGPRIRIHRPNHRDGAQRAVLH